MNFNSDSIFMHEYSGMRPSARSSRKKKYRLRHSILGRLKGIWASYRRRIFESTVDDRRWYKYTRREEILIHFSFHTALSMDKKPTRIEYVNRSCCGRKANLHFFFTKPNRWRKNYDTSKGWTLQSNAETRANLLKITTKLFFQIFRRSVFKIRKSNCLFSSYFLLFLD